MVSAVISDGKSRKLLKKGTTKRYSIVISDFIPKELVTVLRRPKFKTNEDEVHRTILALIRTADVINVKTKINAVKEDSKDNMIIETAIDGEARFVPNRDSTRFCIYDRQEISVMLSSKEDFTKSSLLWSDCASLVEVFKDYYEMMWLTATDLPRLESEDLSRDSGIDTAKPPISANRLRT